MNSRELFQRTQALVEKGQDFVLVTWLKSEGHAPQDIGAKAIVLREGLHWGTVGGGKVEAKAIRLGQELLQEAKPAPPQVLRWDLQRDVGMSCGGAVTVLFECFFARPWSISIFGAGHVGQALVRSLSLLDCHVTCIDSRPEWLERLPPPGPSLAIVQTESMADYAGDLPLGTYAVLVTKGHDNDLPILKRLLKHPDLSYIGVIGSRVKARRLKAELLQAGFSPEESKRFHCPMGIPMRSHQPAEIAVSITAQLLMVKNKAPLMSEEEA